MYDFNKYLEDREYLSSVFRVKAQNKRLFFYLLLLIAIFFVLYPIWRAGRQGFWLWLFVVFLVLNSIIKELLSQKNIYLLTNKRLIYLKAINLNSFKISSYLSLRNISAIKKHGKNSIEFITNGKKYYLSNIAERDSLYKYLETYLNKQNLV